MKASLSPAEVKEIISQSVDYLGIGRIRPFLRAANEILEGMGIAFSLEGQATTTLEKRLEKGM